MEVRIDGEKLRDIIKSKGYTLTQFADMSGLHQPDVSRYLNGQRVPSMATINSMCFVLGIGVDDIKQKEETASSVIVGAETSEALESLKKEVASLKSDLSMMAKMLIQINKTLNEAKAQSELNKEEITATYNKAVDISSNVAKIYGKLVKKY